MPRLATAWQNVPAAAASVPLALGLAGAGPPALLAGGAMLGLSSLLRWLVPTSPSLQVKTTVAPAEDGEQPSHRSSSSSSSCTGTSNGSSGRTGNTDTTCSGENTCGTTTGGGELQHELRELFPGPIGFTECELEPPFRGFPLFFPLPLLGIPLPFHCWPFHWR